MYARTWQFSTNGDEKCRQVIGAVWLVGGSEFKERSPKGEVSESITTVKNIIWYVCRYVHGLHTFQKGTLESFETFQILSKVFVSDMILFEENVNVPFVVQCICTVNE